MADDEKTTEAESYQFQKLPASAYLVGALTQFAVGLHQPFLQTYLVDMQNALYGVKNFAELGAFRSVGNVAPTVLQPIWGAASDVRKSTISANSTGSIRLLIDVYCRPSFMTSSKLFPLTRAEMQPAPNESPAPVRS